MWSKKDGFYTSFQVTGGLCSTIQTIQGVAGSISAGLTKKIRHLQETSVVGVFLCQVFILNYR